MDTTGPSFVEPKPSGMNVSFTEKQRAYITAQLASGDYQNASEVVREALRLHQMYRDRMMEELRAEIAKGWNSPVGKHGVRDIVRKLGKA